MPRVVAANITKRYAILDDGQRLPITNLLDHLGDDTNDPAQAVAFVCGSGAVWFSEALSDYQGATIQ